MVVVAGPVLLGSMGWVSARREPPVAVARWDWRITVASALLYVLAFNLAFFIQELFLVLPKAFTPGLRPTLFHNNHTWAGEHPLASLFQGTGALAVFIVGLACMTLLRSGAGRSPASRLFLIWMAYNGFFQTLPQAVVGALNPRNDVGMAMDYFGLSATAKTLFAWVALGAMPFAAALLATFLLTLAPSPSHIAGARAKTRFVFLAATLPALAAIALIIPFRVPRHWIEVVLLPVVVTIIGISWMQASAWRASVEPVNGPARRWPIVRLLAAATVLLLVFQFVLRPGIEFF
jgi:hypothetical protein